MMKLSDNGTRTIADYAVGLVTALGSDTVFSITGGMAMYLNRAVASNPCLKPVYCQHEQACVAAAEGYAKAADFRRAGFAVITAGPGVSNSVTSLISAYTDSAPLIVLAGQVKTADINVLGLRSHGIQEVPSQALITPCVKRFVRLASQGYRASLVQTFAEALSGRPGPVFVEIPLDVQGLRISYSNEDVAGDAASVRRRAASAVYGRADIVQALRCLLKAKRPLVYVGNGCRIAGVEGEVRAFLARHSLPAVFSWLSFDILPASDPLYFACPGGLAPLFANEVLSRADAILFLGARLDLGTTAFQRHDFGSQAARIFVDVDECELRKFEGYPNTSLVSADLRCLPEAIKDLADATSSAENSWLLGCQERRARYWAEESERLTSERLNVYCVAARLSRWCGGKVVVAASSGYAEETFTRFFAPAHETRFFNGAALGPMGLGLPQGIGASFGSKQQVICLEADGGIMLNVQELATLAHYAPKGFVLFVLNNHGYESIRVSQMRHFGAVSGADVESGLYIPDFCRLAAAFGLRYLRVETPAELDAYLPTLKASAEPVMVDLQIERSENRGPSVKTVMGDDGKPFTTPLSEISW
jgi:acetolactate synthase I/II/III large subunit